MTLSGTTVAVVFGSRSVEHEISILTACQVMPVLEELGAEVVPVYITKDGRWLSHPAWREVAPFRAALPSEGDPVALDLTRGELVVGAGSWRRRPRRLRGAVVFPCTHGPLGEDGTLAGLCRLGRIPWVGCGLQAAALVMRKTWCKAVLAAAGLPVVPGLAVPSAEGAAPALAAAAAAADRLGYPVVVKPDGLGSSIGVSLVAGPEGLAGAVELARTYDDVILLERAVPGARDLNCAVKRGAPRASEVERPLGAGAILSYADKYAPAGKLGAGSIGAATLPGGAGGGAAPGSKGRVRELPADLDPAVRDRVRSLAVAAYDACGCAGTVRVDFLQPEADPGAVVVNELNPIPGSLAAPLWEASGVGMAVLCEELVREALRPPSGSELTLAGNLLATGLGTAPGKGRAADLSRAPRPAS